MYVEKSQQHVRDFIQFYFYEIAACGEALNCNPSIDKVNELTQLYFTIVFQQNEKESYNVGGSTGQSL